MNRIRIPVILNKGKIGIPLYKLSAIVKETENFLKMLAEDIALPGDKKQWLGLDFKSNSVDFIAEYTTPVELSKALQFANTFDNIRRGKDVPGVRGNTRYQYASIAEQLDEDEIIEFGIYKDPESLIAEFFPLSKKDLPMIIGEIQGAVESYGAVQGVIHSVFMGSQPKHFFLRELSTDNLIKCIYSSGQYPELVKVLREESAVVHVYGLITTDMVNLKIEQMVMQQIEAAERLSDKEFEEFFGMCPNLTGQFSTQDFISKVRGRND
jgi:hypothetical protein